MGTRVPSDLFLRFDNPQLFTRNGYSRFVRECRSRRVEELLNLSNIPGVRRITPTECGRFEHVLPKRSAVSDRRNA